MGNSDKAEQCDFLSEAKYLGHQTPGPGKYNERSKTQTLKRSSSWCMGPNRNDPSVYDEFSRKIKKRQSYKPAKVSTPDVGTYKTGESKDFTRLSHPKLSFPKSLSLKFTVEYSKNHKYVPGSGAYKVEKCFDHIARPYVKRRY